MIRAEYLDCCHPAFFQGSDHEEVLAVPVHANMTWSQVLEDASDNFHAQMGPIDYAGAGDDGENALLELFSTMMDNATEPQSDGIPDFLHLVEDTEDTEDEEPIYLYIGLTQEEEEED